MLDWVAERWATPRASDAEKGGPHQKFGTGGEPLTAQAVKWAPPTAHDGRRPGADLSSTNGGNLSRDAVKWATQMAQMNRKSEKAMRLFVDGGQSSPPGLEQQAEALTSMWRTPRSHEVGQYQYERGDPTKPTPTMAGQATILASILPDRPISTVGEPSSPGRRSLNPLFVEWLMGWPPGWTLLALTPRREPLRETTASTSPASTGSACSATALSAWRQRMRCALSSLALPDAAPPAQLDLLGG